MSSLASLVKEITRSLIPALVSSFFRPIFLIGIKLFDTSCFIAIQQFETLFYVLALKQLVPICLWILWLIFLYLISLPFSPLRLISNDMKLRGENDGPKPVKEEGFGLVAL